MKFCNKCKSVMKVNDKDNFECLNCGFMEIKLGDELSVKENIKTGKTELKQGVVDDKNIFAEYDSFICEKCGFDKAQIIERPPYISDEDSLTFLKCGKCNWTKQLARKTR